MKLPNGFGSVSRNGGNRRRPYVVRKTLGYYYEDGKKKRDTVVIGYAKTREEGIQMLSDYNRNPLSGNYLDMTFEEVYSVWSHNKFKAISKSSKDSYVAAYITCKPLYGKKFRSLKLFDLQQFIDTCGKNYPSLKKIKVLLRQMYDYAIKHEICNKDYASMIDLAPYRDQNPDSRPNTRMTYQEVCEIWKYSDDPYMQTVLMLIYSGVRVSELLNLKKENVHLEEHYFEVIKSKTQNGIRIVPIADCVYPFWDSWYHRHEECTYMICNASGGHFCYSNYARKYYKPRLLPLGITKTPHSCRHTCASLLKENGVDFVIAKKIIGHSSKDVTESVYIHLDVPTLLSAINKIPYPQG